MQIVQQPDHVERLEYSDKMLNQALISSVINQDDQMRFTINELKSPKKLMESLEKRLSVLNRIEQDKKKKDLLKQKQYQKQIELQLRMKKEYNQRQSQYGKLREEMLSENRKRAQTLR